MTTNPPELNLKLRHSPQEGVIRSTDDCPGILAVAIEGGEVYFTVTSTAQIRVDHEPGTIRMLRSREDPPPDSVRLSCEEVVSAAADLTMVKMLWTHGAMTLMQVAEDMLVGPQIDVARAAVDFLAELAVAILDAGWATSIWGGGE